MLPPLAWWARAVAAGSVQVSVAGSWRRQTLMNRAWVKGPQGPFALTIPVVHPPHGTPYAQVQIDWSKPWVRQWQGSLQAAYGRSAYGAEILPRLLDPLAGRPDSLADLNRKWLLALAEALGRQAPGITFVDTWNIEADTVISLHSPLDFHLKTYSHPQFQPRPYSQAFGAFVPNLSIVDLQAQEGPYAGTYLRECWVSHLVP